MSNYELSLSDCVNISIYIEKPEDIIDKIPLNDLVGSGYRVIDYEI